MTPAMNLGVNLLEHRIFENGYFPVMRNIHEGRIAGKGYISCKQKM